MWNQRIQDKGYNNKGLPELTYKKSRIMAFVKPEIPLYYFDLTSIAIDMASKMEVEKKMGQGWIKLPKNKKDVKVIIIERLLALRKFINNEYVLD